MRFDSDARRGVVAFALQTLWKSKQGLERHYEIEVTGSRAIRGHEFDLRRVSAEHRQAYGAGEGALLEVQPFVNWRHAHARHSYDKIDVFGQCCSRLCLRQA